MGGWSGRLSGRERETVDGSRERETARVRERGSRREGRSGRLEGEGVGLSRRG